MRHITMAAALILAVTSSPLWGQTPAEHDAHHPSANAAAAPAQPVPPTAQAQPSPTQPSEQPGQAQGSMMTNCPMMSGGQGGAMNCPMMSGQAPGSTMPGMGPGMMHRQTQGMAPGMMQAPKQDGQVPGGSGPSSQSPPE